MKITKETKATDITIRQHFATMAMQGILSSAESFAGIIEVATEGGIGVSDFLAEMSIAHADALIEALNKSEQ